MVFARPRCTFGWFPRDDLDAALRLCVLQAEVRTIRCPERLVRTRGSIDGRRGNMWFRNRLFEPPTDEVLTLILITDPDMPDDDL